MMEYYSHIRWVDEYIKRVSPYIHVREHDHLLIKIPNEAHKINASGVAILKTLLEGNSIYTVVDRYPDKEQVSRDLHYFFCDIMSLLKGCYHEWDDRKAVEHRTFALPFNTLPVLSEIAVTYRCNLACQFCYAACGCRKDIQGEECSIDQLKQVLTVIREEAEVPSVSFTGGEPTLRADLPELVRFAKSLKMWTNLITNGTLITRSQADTLKAAGLDSAQVSLEAADAHRHDRIVRSYGAFAKTLTGLRALRDAKVRVHTNTTISALNKDHLNAVLSLVRDEGFDKFSMNLIMPEGSAAAHLPDVLVRYSDIGRIVLDVQREARNLGLEFMWYSPTPLCIFNPIVHGLGNRGCAACDGLLSIAPNGDILPCSSFPRPMGNILDMQGRFRELWAGPAFQYFQRKHFAHEQCQACEDLAVCNGGCPLYWRQVGYEELLQHKPMEVGA
ncbi:MAG: radical SAM protein [Candidatus Omnitrophota bacterium]